jgi:hypothetical protein
MVQKSSGSPASFSAIRDIGLSCSVAALLAMSGPASAAQPPGLQLIGGPDGNLRRPRAMLVQAQAEAADFKAADVKGPSGRPIPLKIEAAGSAEKNANQLFIFTGLPEGVTLSPGGNFGDFWAVNASVINDLELTAPPGFSGTFTMWITRSRDQGNSARSVPITVTIGGPAAVPTVAATTATAPVPGPAARETTGSTAKPRGGALPNEKMLLTRAADSFEKGDVSGARVIYEYLAMQGSSAAAMAMGESYDPLVLAKMVVKGLEPDPKKAQQWYEKAEELGSREARSRLNALAAR